MSTIKHREIDVLIDGTWKYATYHVDDDPGADVNEFHIRYDSDVSCLAWVFNRQSQRMPIFVPGKQEVIVNLYDPFRKRKVRV